MSGKRQNRKLPALFKTRGCYSRHDRRLHLTAARIHGRSVVLQPRVIKHLREAIRDCNDHGIHIEPVSTWRSCETQRATCVRICGNPNGCSGTCAKPGSSYHQIGVAVDIYVHNATPSNVRTYRRIMGRHGFKNFSGPSGSDPNHWTLGVVPG